MKEQLTDAWARRLETTKDAEVSRAGKAREILHLQAWRGKERERSLLPNARGACMCVCACVCVCVCVCVCTWALQILTPPSSSSHVMFTVGQGQSEAQDQGSPLI